MVHEASFLFSSLRCLLKAFHLEVHGEKVHINFFQMYVGLPDTLGGMVDLLNV